MMSDKARLRPHRYIKAPAINATAAAPMATPAMAPELKPADLVAGAAAAVVVVGEFEAVGDGVAEVPEPEDLGLLPGGGSDSSGKGY